MFNGISSSFVKVLVLWLAVLSFMLAGKIALAEQPYTVTDLGTLGGLTSQATDVNSSGQIVGYSITATGETHAFLWQDGVMKDLGTLGGTYSNATDINDAGQVVGYSTTESGKTNAFIWQNGVMTNLGDMGGQYSSAKRVNELGQVTGVYMLFPGTSSGFIWQDGVMTDLGTIPGESYYTPVDINDAGEIAVVLSTAGSSIWSNGSLGVLPVLTDTEVSAISKLNRYGKAVGSNMGSIPGTWSSAVLWDNNGVTDLGTLGGPISQATDVNDSDVVIGKSTDSSASPHGFSWQDGVMTDLGQGVTPLHISNKGAIIGLKSVPGQYNTGIFIDKGDLTLLKGIDGNLTSRVSAVNNSKQVVGNSRNISNLLHATLWTFAKDMFPLTVSAAGGFVDVDPFSADGLYESDSVVTLTANADPGYVFMGWSGDAAGADPIVSLTMDAAKSVTANFEPVPADDSDLPVASGSFSTGFCGKTMRGNKRVPIHVVLEGGNPDDVPTVTITFPDGQVVSEPMVKLGKGKDAWRYDSFKFSSGMPEGEYTVEVTRGGASLEPPLACSFTYVPKPAKSNKK